MDLGKLKIKEENWLVINDPSGAPTDIEILIVSRDSETFKKAQRRIAELRRRRGKGLKQPEEEQLWIELFATCTKDWKNVVENGKILECNFENVVYIYKNPIYNFVLEQVAEFIGDRENFFEN